jgi:acetyl esterase/lipase
MNMLYRFRKLMNFFLTTGILLMAFVTKAQQIINLYPSTIPNAKATTMQEDKSLPQNGMYRKVLTPTLELYLPEKEKASGAAVVICPGGGYSVIVYQGEGISNAKQMAQNGVAAFVLKYRLPNDSSQQDQSIAPLQDAQQAIKLVRERASEWGLDANKIGIMGFSAGGHLASTEATHFSKALIENTNNTSLRPDFQILVGQPYPWRL